MRYRALMCFIITFFCLTFNIYAKNYTVEIKGNAVNLRASNSTSSSILKSLAKGAVYSTDDATLYPDGGGCGAGWYKINVGATTGYVCSKYAILNEVIETVVEVNSDCENEMRELGFPESYWQGLCSLKEKHPTWKFTPLNTFLDFKTAVEAEASCGESYIQTNREDYIDTSCKSAYPATSSWKPASQKAVAHYMDPRNYFQEKYIFQFEYLKYDSTLSEAYVNGAVAILKNAAFFQFHSPNGNELASVINQAGGDTDVSPVFLSSRMLQELGNTDKLYNLYSGLYDGDNNEYYGYFNFFNYGVSDSCATTYGTTYCGLRYAKNNEWNSTYNAIKGAALSLSKNYISAGQYTGYLQKFNVVPTNISKLYLHQYMTNIAAPSSESVSAYNTYKKLDILETPFMFYIPVYHNMGVAIENSNNGATNDNGGENGGQDGTLSISTIVTSCGYNYSKNYISKIDLGTNIPDFKAHIESVSGNNSVKITDNDGNEITSGTLSTGNKVLISNGKTVETLIVIIKGDTSGDGVVNALDLLQVQKNILGTYNLKDAYSLAGDTSGDGVVNALDLLQVQKNILGSYNIEQ